MKGINEYSSDFMTPSTLLRLSRQNHNIVTFTNARSLRIEFIFVYTIPTKPSPHPCHPYEISISYTYVSNENT